MGGTGVTPSVTPGQHGLEVDLASGTPGTQESELYLAVT